MFLRYGTCKHTYTCICTWIMTEAQNRSLILNEDLTNRGQAVICVAIFILTISRYFQIFFLLKDKKKNINKIYAY